MVDTFGIAVGVRHDGAGDGRSMLPGCQRLGRRTAEFAVGRPPHTKADALALAWEYTVYNDGCYDYYRAGNLTDLAASQSHLAT